MSVMKNAKITLLVGLVIGLVAGAAGTIAINSTVLNGGTSNYVITTAGSTTVYPLSQEWATKFASEMPEFTLQVNSGGSGLGQQQIASKLIDIGASSSYPDEDYFSTNPSVKAIPVAGDALGVVVNPAINGSVMKLDCDMVVAIFQREITTWDELESTFNVEIQQTGPINVYVRSDASGTTATFAKWLETADETANPYANYTWTLGHHETVSWPNDVFAVTGNPSVASGVKGDDHGIGYVGLAFIDSELTPVHLLNPSTGEYVEPTQENALKALPEVLTDLRQNLMNSATPGAYPIARLLFYLINTENLRWYVIIYLQWALIQGQNYVATVGYLPIAGSSAQAYSLSVIQELVPTS